MWLKLFMILFEIIGQSVAIDRSHMINWIVPIISVSMNNDPKNYTQRLLRSIDFPVGVVAVQIGSSDPEVVSAIIGSLNSTLHNNQNIRNTDITVVSHNPGSANGFNFGLRHLLKAELSTAWVLHVNNDVAFYPGVLRNIHRSAEKALSHDPQFGIGFTSLCCGSEWSAVVFTKRMVAVVGLFDENFYPAYYEDGTYYCRAQWAHIVYL